MKKFILIILIVQLIALVNSYRQFSLCKEDVFEYNNKIVNSFLRVEKNINYGSISTYLAKPNLTSFNYLERIDIQSKLAKHNLIDVPWLYNNLLNQYFEEKNLLEERSKYLETKLVINNLRKKYSNNKNKDETKYDEILKSIDKPIQLIDDLLPISRYQLNINLYSKNELNSFLNKYLIKINAKNFIFNNLDDYYNQKIAKYFKSYQDTKNDNLIFSFHILIPVTQRIRSVFKCKNAKDLSPFFQQK